MLIRIGKYAVGKECGGRWFPGIGRGYWDGLRYYLFHSKKIHLKFRTFDNPRNDDKGFAIGPLMFWKENDVA